MSVPMSRPIGTIAFAFALLASSLLLSVLANAARAADCLAAPNSAAPANSHWYYRIARNSASAGICVPPMTVRRKICRLRMRQARIRLQASRISWRNAAPRCPITMSSNSIPNSWPGTGAPRIKAALCGTGISTCLISLISQISCQKATVYKYHDFRDMRAIAVTKNGHKRGLNVTSAVVQSIGVRHERCSTVLHKDAGLSDCGGPI